MKRSTENYELFEEIQTCPSEGVGFRLERRHSLQSTGLHLFSVICSILRIQTYRQIALVNTQNGF